jgi:L-serine dehydratase
MNHDSLSVFDMFKVGVGPSSSHTLGPWNAMLHFLGNKIGKGQISQITSLHIELYGSLAKTGIGHGTDIAVMMGLLGEFPHVTDTDLIGAKIQNIKATKQLKLYGMHKIPFIYEENILFKPVNLPYHPNAMVVTANIGKDCICETYYSVGGGFIEWESEIKEPSINDDQNMAAVITEYSVSKAKDIIRYCESMDYASISDFVINREKQWRTPEATLDRARSIWEVMKDCIFKGCHTDGILPGGLDVHRRAKKIVHKLMEEVSYDDADSWVDAIKSKAHPHPDIFKWVSAFALAVNEQNAAFGRVVTAPTNGAAGVIPAVLMYYVCFSEKYKEENIARFLLTAGQVGILFKINATISAAMGGCQAEIGVSSAMAAAALTECIGGTFRQALVAAEIAMEHHLGMTCDPVGGLVQIPCIERNSMGAIKAINAAYLAMETEPGNAKVDLDEVILAMWETALDMNHKYKETAEGGLALQIPIGLSEC